MVRNAIVVKRSRDGKRLLCLDAENADEILNFTERDARHIKKFEFISQIILEGLRVPDVYDKEEINQKCKGITAMKFFKGQENARLYCKEITLKDKTFVVVAVQLLERKKNQKLSHREISIIERIAEYDYQID